MIRLVYTFFCYLSLPFVLLRLAYKAYRNPAYAKRIPERFGFFTASASANDFWIHAVSLGEVIAAIPLIKSLLQQYPNKKIAVTTMTPTGSARLIKEFPTQVFHVYVPYDLPDAIQRFLKRVQPRMAIIMETELWPNLFYACHKKNIKLLVVNARLSAKSARGYRRIAWLIKPLLKNINLIATQTGQDAKRFIALGADKQRVHVMGNLKYDLLLPDHLFESIQQLKKQLNLINKHVVLASSTHEPEENFILEIFAELKIKFPELTLMIAPRHPERFQEVYELSRNAQWKTIKRSELPHNSADKNIQLNYLNFDVLIIDSIGELLLFYGLADIALVGGSWVKIGGHNILEPAALGIPSITGPHMFNFSAIQKLLAREQITFMMQDKISTENKILEFLMCNELREEIKQRAIKLIHNNQGACQKLMQKINAACYNYIK